MRTASRSANHKGCGAGVGAARSGLRCVPAGRIFETGLIAGTDSWGDPLGFAAEYADRKGGGTNLKVYFGPQQGIGPLSTSDAQGRAGAAVHSRPHVFEKGASAFARRDRLTHHHASQNARAAHLFVEKALPLIGAGQG